MSAADRMMTSGCLSGIREEAKREGVSIPKGLTTYRHSGGTNTYFEVWSDNGIVWEGNAYNASDAKFKYICTLFPKEEE